MLPRSLVRRLPQTVAPANEKSLERGFSRCRNENGPHRTAVEKNPKQERELWAGGGSAPNRADDVTANAAARNRCGTPDMELVP